MSSWTLCVDAIVRVNRRHSSSLRFIPSFDVFTSVAFERLARSLAPCALYSIPYTVVVTSMTLIAAARRRPSTSTSSGRACYEASSDDDGRWRPFASSCIRSSDSVGRSLIPSVGHVVVVAATRARATRSTSLRWTRFVVTMIITRRAARALDAVFLFHSRSSACFCNVVVQSFVSSSRSFGHSVTRSIGRSVVRSFVHSFIRDW